MVQTKKAIGGNVKENVSDSQLIHSSLWILVAAEQWWRGANTLILFANSLKGRFLFSFLKKLDMEGGKLTNVFMHAHGFEHLALKS